MTDVGLGDAIRALAGLDPDEATSARIATMLGLALRPRTGTGLDLTFNRGRHSAAVSAPPDRLPEPAEATAETVPEEATAIVGPTAELDHQGAMADAPTSTVPWSRILQPVPRTRAAQARTAVVPLEPEPASVSSTTMLALEPLFAPRQEPRALQALTATDAGDGPLDIDGVVEALSTRRRFDRLPRTRRLSLFRGVQVLVDVGETMAPFRRDGQHLISALRSMVGRSLVDARFFAGLPSNGSGPGAIWTWGPHRPPAPGTPVLAFTDFGIPALATTFGAAGAEWTAFADGLARQDSPLVILTAFPAERRPSGLGAHLNVVRWDRMTRL